MKKIIPIALIFLVLDACKTDPQTNESQSEETTEIIAKKDYLIVPGERIGMITAETTESEVEKAYGRENLKFTSVTVAEGEEQQGVVVFPETKNELEIIWELAANIGNPAFVRLGNEGSDWQTTEGIGVGTTLEKLEEINGKPFSFYGFEWDYGGLVTNWNDGNISPFLVVALIPQNFDKLNSDVIGEVILSSDDPKVRALNAKVGSLVVTFK